MGIYLDYNASAPIDSRVLEVMVDAYKNHIGNADSRTHDFGEDAMNQVNQARVKIASLLGIEKNEVFFTSGSTESNNIAILGLRAYGLKTNHKHILTTSIEHKAVIKAARHLENDGFEVETISPDLSGRISTKELLSKVRKDTLLVSVMHVNNETGIIQPVDEIGECLSSLDVLFHIDATQSCGKLVKEIRNLKYNMMSISAHKMHGPQGIGALILKKKRFRLPPITSIMYGGSQEHGIRPGTLPTALIAGFGTACEIAENEFEVNMNKCEKIKRKIITILDESGVDFLLNGSQEWCVPNTLNVSFPGVASEALMLATKKYCGVSNGSACTSSDYSASHVLSAMKIPDERIESAIRISWGPDIDAVDLAKDFRKLLEMVECLGGVSRNN